MITPITDSAISRIEKAHTKSGANVTTKYKAAFAALGGAMRDLEQILNNKPMNHPLSNCCGRPPLGEIHNGFAHCSDCKEMAEFQHHDEEPDPISLRRSFEEWWTWEGQYLPGHGMDVKDIAKSVWLSAIANIITPHEK